MSKLYCKDCRHFGAWLGLDLCLREESRDVVGRFQSAKWMRQAGSPCGPDALLFEAKPPAVVKTSWWRRLKQAWLTRWAPGDDVRIEGGL
jgi:hypothetical protein